MTRDDLLERLDGTEWIDFEVKSARGGVPVDAFRSLSAFANSGGGWMVFGVAELADGYEIQGIDDIDAFQNDLLGACRSPEKLRRPASVHPRLLRCEEGWVLALRVDEAPRFDKPIRVRIKGRWEAYVRVGGGDHRCTPEEEGRFVRDASHERYDQSPCPDFDLEDLDEEAIDWLRGLIALRQPGAADAALSRFDWLTRTGLIRRRSGSLTHAAALLFGQPHVLAAMLPGGAVDLRIMYSLARDGVPHHRWDDRIFCESHLADAMQSLFERFHRLCPQPFAFEAEGPLRRARSLEEDVLREALVNLFAHQDYADVHRTATILWWRDRVIFTNPGDSYVATTDLWSGGFSESRNPLILRLLRQAGLAEQAGSGLPFIWRAWAETGRPEPTLRNDGARKRFEMVFAWGEELYDRASGECRRIGRGEPVKTSDDPVNEPVKRSTDPVNVSVSSGEPVSLTAEGSRSAYLIQILKDRPGLRVPALAKRLHVSESSVKRALRILKSEGKVYFLGAPKTGGYYLTAENGSEPE